MRSTSPAVARCSFSAVDCAFDLAHQFVQADRHRLAQVHRDVLFARGNAHQPVAVAEVLVGQPDLLRAEQQRDAADASCLRMSRAPCSSRRSGCCNSR